MSSLAASFSKYKSELAETAARNSQYARPGANIPPRTSTPKPSSSTTAEKRTHDAAFTSTTTATSAPGGRELMTQVWNAVTYLKDKNFSIVPFDHIISYLSLPTDAQRNIPLIRRALQGDDRVEYIPKGRDGHAKEGFKYRPLHPVTSAADLRNYMAGWTGRKGAQGLSVKELKDGWPDCGPAIDQLEAAGHILVVRNKKDNTPRTLWPDSPTFHIAPPPPPPTTTTKPATGGAQTDPTMAVVGKIDPDFLDYWHKTKLPANDADIRQELERAGLTPTSAVRETGKVEMRKKERKRTMRRGGKTTNAHMMGILKEYPGKR